MNKDSRQALAPDSKAQLAELWYCTPQWQAEKVKTGNYPQLYAEMRKLNEEGHDYWIKEA